ncbi:MAG: hypothetical protein Q9180_008594, partial [Flavoplaca navasiana]
IKPRKDRPASGSKTAQTLEPEEDIEMPDSPHLPSNPESPSAATTKPSPASTRPPVGYHSTGGKSFGTTPAAPHVSGGKVAKPTAKSTPKSAPKSKPKPTPKEPTRKQGRGSKSTRSAASASRRGKPGPDDAYEV